MVFIILPPTSCVSKIFMVLNEGKCPLVSPNRLSIKAEIFCEFTLGRNLYIG